MVLVSRVIGVLLALCVSTAAFAQSPPPTISRIKMATIGAPDLKKIKDWYTGWLGFKVREEGHVSAAMAASWGAPKSAGRPFVIMSSDGSPDVLIRAVEIDAVKGYKFQTTLGWNAFEIIVDDLDKLNTTLAKSPFTILGTPHALGGRFPTIWAMQVAGPADEVLYLTSEKGDREKSTLPIPKAQVDRPFILILAVPDLEAARDFYAQTFGMTTFPIFDGKLTRVTQALGLPQDVVYHLTLVRAAERGNSIEIDGYPAAAQARPHAPGQLVPGNAMATFNVNSLDGLKVKFVTPPANNYGPRRSAVFIGPAGEPTELIEQPRP